jgi:hypothetical protein
MQSIKQTAAFRAPHLAQHRKLSAVQRLQQIAGSIVLTAGVVRCFWTSPLTRLLSHPAPRFHPNPWALLTTGLAAAPALADGVSFNLQQESKVTSPVHVEMSVQGMAVRPAGG